MNGFLNKLGVDGWVSRNPIWIIEGACKVLLYLTFTICYETLVSFLLPSSPKPLEKQKQRILEMLVWTGILTVTLLKQSFRVSWSFGSHLTPTVTVIHISAVAVPSLSLKLCTFI